MANAKKVENYTTTQANELKAAYVANPTKETVQIFADKFGKPTRSIVAKLSREGVYQSAKYVTKAGKPPVRKNELVDLIAAACGVPAEKLGSLETATKEALLAIFSALGGTREEAEQAQAD